MTAIDLLLAAMVLVESSGDDDAIGDDGSSRGPLQIGRLYWTDAVDQLAKEGNPIAEALDYEVDVFNRRLSMLIVKAYWRKWAPRAYESGDLEVLARCHNGGGPRWREKPATLHYWRKVKAELDKQKRR